MRRGHSRAARAARAPRRGQAVPDRQARVFLDAAHPTVTSSALARRGAAADRARARGLAAKGGVEMISAEYFECLKATRAQFPYWGSGGVRHAAPVVALLEDLGVRQGTILDYGSGVGAFGDEVRRLCGARYAVTNYEPTLPQWS